MPPLAAHRSPDVGGQQNRKNVEAGRKGDKWSATYPDNSDPLAYSRMFMARTLYISFAHIMESRRVLPSSMFRKRSIDNMVKTYVMDLSQPNALRIADKFRGAGEAIGLGFLREFTLVIGTNEDDEDEAIEAYTWRMRYDTDGTPSAEFIDGDGNRHAALRWLGLDAIKKQTRTLLFLIRRLCRQLLTPLPAGAVPSFRITYTDAAPKGYQAPGFYRYPLYYKIDEQAEQIVISSLNTNHHGVSLSVRSIYIDDSYTLSMKLKESGSGNVSREENLNDSLISLDNEESDSSGNTSNVDRVMSFTESNSRSTGSNSANSKPVESNGRQRKRVSDQDDFRRDTSTNSAKDGSYQHRLNSSSSDSSTHSPTAEKRLRSRRERNASRKMIGEQQDESPTTPGPTAQHTPGKATSDVTPGSTPPKKEKQ